MQGTVNTISMDEAAARRIVLVQAIETTDTQGELVSEPERAQIDREAIESARAVGEGSSPTAIRHFLKERARRVLETVRKRSRVVASWQQASPWERWLAGGIPVAALVLGLFADQVANPHRINLLSGPLLLLVFWNLVVYAVLAVRYLLARSGVARPRFAGLPRWLEAAGSWRRRPGQVATAVTGAFLTRWHALTAQLHGKRLARVMHLSAAAWGLGAALSLVSGGLLVKYRVEWESTWLSPENVHRLLNVLFKPVTVLFPGAAFSLEEVRALEAGAATLAGAAAAQRWVFLYAMLLALVVVLPRLVLAGVAWWRERSLAGDIRLDLGESYYQRLIASLSPAQVHLCLYAHRGEDRAALLRVLLHGSDWSLGGVGLGQGQAHDLLRGPGGEVLRVLDLPNVEDPVAMIRKQRSRQQGWSGRLLDAVLGRPVDPPDAVDEALRTAQENADLVLHVVGSAADLEAAAPLRQWLGKPVLVLVNPDRGAAAASEALLAHCRARVAEASPIAGVLSFDDFARCWIQERVLLAAVGRSLPAYKSRGWARLVAAWDERNRDHFRDAMAVIARHLLEAARQTEEVGTAPRSIMSRVNAGEREAHERRTREAMAAVVARLQRSDAQATARLLSLHGVGEATGGALDHRLEEKFVVQEGVSARQAGVAGAATGAAMGVSIDLLTAGLTLGMAAAAGALVGGSAAWVAAAWKNKATPSGTSIVQLSDDMLQAMVEAGLLRYLAVIHFERGRPGSASGEIRPGWRSEVVAAVERRSEDLKEQWATARSRQDAVLEPAAALVAILETIAMGVLRKLYPGPADRP